MTVLSDRQIFDLCAVNALVDPYRLEDIQPASIDMRLGDRFIVFDKHEERIIDLADVKDRSAREVGPDGDGGFTLHPGEFVLGQTLETVRIPINLMARIEGKSSIGRLGIMVHVTAGFIDPGFVGPITLEIVNLRSIPIILRPGLPFCQLSFHMMDTVPIKAYNGRYQNAKGVEASLYGKTRVKSSCCGAEIRAQAPGSGDLSTECSACGLATATNTKEPK